MPSLNSQAECRFASVIARSAARLVKSVRIEYSKCAFSGNAVARISVWFISLRQVVGKTGQLVHLDDKTTRAQRLLGLPAHFAVFGEGPSIQIGF
jgi:hypothetical protein